jgi:hypothetical protein
VIPVTNNCLGAFPRFIPLGQARALQAVNVHITETYWQIGRDIVEFEQGGKIRADFMEKLCSPV